MNYGEMVIGRIEAHCGKKIQDRRLRFHITQAITRQNNLLMNVHAATTAAVRTADRAAEEDES